MVTASRAVPMRTALHIDLRDGVDPSIHAAMAPSHNGADLLDSLPRERSATAHALGAVRTYDEGSVIRPANDLCIILTGRVKVSRRTPGGRTVVLGLLGPREMVLDETLSQEEQGSLSVVAMMRTDCLLLPRPALLAFVHASPRTAAELIESLLARLNTADDLRVQYMDCNTNRRLARLLLRLARPEAVSSPALIVAGLSQDELASYVGASRDAVSRALRAMRRRGLVETGRLGIRLLDEQGVRALAGLDSKEARRG